jgi:MFS family permease
MNHPVTVRRAGRYQELAGAWPVVGASFVGIMMSGVVLPFYLLGPLFNTVSLAFSWPRGSVSTCLSLLAAGGTLGTWLVRRWVDRVPARVIATLGMAAFAICFALIGLVGQVLWHFELLYFLIGFLGSGSGPMTYTRAIGERVTEGRGLALGLALSGMGAAGFAAPLLVHQVTVLAGWRGACSLVTAVVFIVGIPVVWVGLRSVKAPGLARDAPITAGSAQPVQRIARDPRFLLLIVIVCAFGLFIGSLIVNLVPMLVSGGIDVAQASRLAALLGAAGLLGRLVIGWLLDRLWSAVIGAVLFLTAAVAALVLGFAVTPLRALSTVIIFGLLTGAELDLMSYMTLQYFRIDSYGRIYGLIFSIYTAVSIVGPYLAAYIIGRGGYEQLLLATSVGFIVAASAYGFLAFLTASHASAKPDRIQV